MVSEGCCRYLFISRAIPNVRPAVYYASVSASFVIQQLGLPRLTISSKGKEEWKGDDPYKRLAELRERSS